MGSCLTLELELFEETCAEKAETSLGRGTLAKSSRGRELKGGTALTCDLWSQGVLSGSLSGCLVVIQLRVFAGAVLIAHG